MDSITVFLIALAAVISLCIVLYQYYYKNKKKGRVHRILSFLRFLGIFGTFVLLINPKFKKNTYSLEKANLVVLVDNSSSIRKDALGETAIKNTLDVLESNTEIADLFNVKQYRFGELLREMDTLGFNDKNTNISSALESVNEIYDNSTAAVVLLTDGNHTYGEDYEFYGKNQKFPIYPIAVGDTTQYEDVRIGQVNSNAYAFLKNKYPVEAYISYQGDGEVQTAVRILIDGKRVFNTTITLSKTANTKTINAVLNASTVGIKTLRIIAEPLKNERNISNNQKDISLEVIDEKTSIAIISDVLHPDIGALKKSIESNEQRSVVIKKPTTALADLEDVDVFILYQPNTAFKTIYKYIEQKGASTFTITGGKTNWNFLNDIQQSFSKNSYRQLEEVSPTLNTGFSIFSATDFTITDFPPLETNLGDIIINKPYQTILEQRIRGVQLKQPLLAVLESDDQKEAVLFGENLWKWRVQSYRNQKDFNNFDDFMGKILLYLATTKPKNRLTLEYKAIYTGSNEARIGAAYFDKSFVFDTNANIIIKVKGKGNDINKEVPMLLKGSFYAADLSDLPSGEYTFTVDVKNDNRSKSGSFKILDFDVEQQFLSTDYKKLQRLAQQTNGKFYFPAETANMVKDLLSNNVFVPVQKSKENIVSLIDFRFLLGIIITAFTIEWFIRKYNGLI